MLGILESQFVSNLGDGHVCAEYHLFGLVHELILDVFLRRFARLFFD